MQIIKSFEDVSSLSDNKIIGAENITFIDSEIRFSGEGNILVCEENVKLKNSQLKFNGDNCVIYLSSSSHYYILDVTVYRNSVFYMGKNNYINGALHAVLSEQKNIIIGNDNLFSFGVWIRTADPHLVYSVESNKRVNPSKSVFIGDHVWIGQGAMILKGSKIGSGSILGAMALCAGKTIPSNTSWGGNPAKEIGSGIFWSGESVHSWDGKQTAEHETFMGKPFVYKKSEKNAFDYSETVFLTYGENAEDKLEYLKSLSENKDRNRFYIKPSDKRKGKRGKLWQR